MMKKIDKRLYVVGVIINSFFLALSGCLEDFSSDKIGVVVTVVPQIEMVRAIGGTHVDITVMVPPGESPHSFELKPSQLRKVATATLYFKVGSGVEFEEVHMGAVMEQNPNLQVFDCSKNISVVSFNEHFGHNGDSSEKHDTNDTGHDEKGTDPHIWVSPVNFKKMAQVVYEGLTLFDQNHQKEYSVNFNAYIAGLDNLHITVNSMLYPFHNKSFLVYHPAWGYFGDTYNLKQIAIEVQGKQPGPAGVAAIIEQAKKENITMIFVSPQFDTTSAEAIASEINGKVILVDPLMMNYESTILHLATEMSSGFQNYHG